MRIETYKKLITHPDFFLIFEAAIGKVAIELDALYSGAFPAMQLAKACPADVKVHNFCREMLHKKVEISWAKATLISWNFNDTDEIECIFNPSGGIADIPFEKNVGVLIDQIKRINLFYGLCNITEADLIPFDHPSMGAI